MDAHFSEYLAAVAGMQDVYGHGADDHPTEFHEAAVAVVVESATAEAAAG